MKKTLIGATAMVVTLFISACGAGGEAVPATAQPLSVGGTVEGSPPFGVTVIEDESSVNPDVVLARGTLGSGVNPSMNVTLTDPIDVDGSALQSISQTLSDGGCPGISVMPSNAKYATLLGFSVFEDDEFNIFPDGYLFLTDAADVDGLAAGDTIYAYWLVDREATVRGSCEGDSISVNLAEGWNLVSVTLRGDSSAAVRHVASPKSDARWIWSTSSLGLF